MSCCQTRYTGLYVGLTYDYCPYNIADVSSGDVGIPRHDDDYPVEALGRRAGKALQV